MDPQFWHTRWQNQQIGFHSNQINPFLIQYLPSLQLGDNARIFVPLCGKTLDIHWLLAQGYHVCGAELSEIAIEQLFAELNLKPQIENIGALKHYHAQWLDIFVGDIFDLTHDTLGKVDAIYDRAALVALPQSMRSSYARHVQLLSQHAPQLLIQYQYDQSLMDGPPFAIAESEMLQLYADYADKTLLLEQLLVNDKLNERIANQSEVVEKVWFIHN